MGSVIESHLVVAGLGNPGKKYEFSRHNLGYLVVKELARELGLSFKEERHFQSWVAKGQSGGIVLHLLLPTTYMNESGRAVRAYLDYYKLGPQHILVVTDDIHLPFQDMRIRLKGSSGGHNGLKSIEACLGTQEYSRLRMGIGRKQEAGTLADYVLDNFAPEELVVLTEVTQKGANVVKRIINT